jgi:hypothetical protein
MYKNTAVLFLKLSNHFLNPTTYGYVEELAKELNPTYFNTDALRNMIDVRCYGDKCRKTGEGGEWCESCNGEFMEEVNCNLGYFLNNTIKLSEIQDTDVLGAFFRQVEISDPNQLLSLLTKKAESTHTSILSTQTTLANLEQTLLSLPERIRQTREKITEYQNVVQLTEDHIARINETIQANERLAVEQKRQQDERQRLITIQQKKQQLERLQNEINQLQNSK